MHRAQKKGYEEVHVPAVKHIPAEGERLVPVEDLPDWVQPAFKVRLFASEEQKICDYIFSRAVLLSLSRGSLLLCSVEVMQ